MQFKLVTYIDRVNYISDTFISYYKKIFSPEEFIFMVTEANYSKIREYLDNNGLQNAHIRGLRTRTSFGFGENVHNQNAIVKSLVENGFTVVYADIDELIYHPNLKEYIENKPDKLIAAKGMLIFQHPSEPYLDSTKKVFEQRSYCKFNDHYFSKVCILKEPFKWTPGRHNRPKNCAIDNNLYLIDIGKICKNLIVQNNEINKRMYQEIYWRYAESNINKILGEWDGLLGPGFAPIPQELKDSCPF